MEAQGNNATVRKVRVVDVCNDIHALCDAIQMAQTDRCRNMRHLLVMFRLRVMGRFTLRHAVLGVVFDVWAEVAAALREGAELETKSPRRRKITNLHESFNQLLFMPFPEDWDEAMEWAEQVEKMFAVFYRIKLGHWRK